MTKQKVKVPSRLSKWVMKMQDVDYELMYEARKGKPDSGTTFPDTHFLRQMMTRPRRVTKED